MPFQHDHLQYKYKSPNPIHFSLVFDLVYGMLIKIIIQNHYNTILKTLKYHLSQELQLSFSTRYHQYYCESYPRELKFYFLIELKLWPWLRNDRFYYFLKLNFRECSIPRTDILLNFRNLCMIFYWLSNQELLIYCFPRDAQ